METYINKNTRLFDSDLGRLEIIIGFIEKIKKIPARKEDFFGIHEFNEDEVEITLTSVEIVIPHGQAHDILPMLSEKQKEYIIDNLD